MLWRCEHYVCMSMQSLDDAHRELLEKVKSLHSDVKNAINDKKVDNSILNQVKYDTAQIHQKLRELRRQSAMQTEQHDITIAIMKEEMKNELVEREAISARTAERFRALCSKGSPGVHSAFDRAVRTASSIDACVNSLSCESTNCSQGTVLLHQQAMEKDVSLSM